MLKSGRMTSANPIADSYHAKKHCSRLSLSKVRFYLENGPLCFIPFDGEGGISDTGTFHGDKNCNNTTL